MNVEMEKAIENIKKAKIELKETLERYKDHPNRHLCYYYEWEVVQEAYRKVEIELKKFGELIQ